MRSTDKQAASKQAAPHQLRKQLGIGNNVLSSAMMLQALPYLLNIGNHHLHTTRKCSTHKNNNEDEDTTLFFLYARKKCVQERNRRVRRKESANPKPSQCTPFWDRRRERQWIPVHWKWSTPSLLLYRGCFVVELCFFFFFPNKSSAAQ